MTNTLIVIGAGGDPQGYLDQGYETVVLIEPHPRLAAALRRNTDDNESVIVEEMAVTTDSSLNLLHEFNLLELSSLRKPTGLKQLYPGLKKRETYSVTTISPTELLDRHSLPDDGQHRLVVNAPGEEVNILNSLIIAGVINSFQSICLAARHAAYYEGESTVDETIAKLLDVGFEQHFAHIQSDDWPLWEFKVNPLQKIVERLQGELEQKELELHSHNAERDSLQAEIKHLSARTHRTREYEVQCNEAAKRENALKAKLEEHESENSALQQKLQLQKEYAEKLNATNGNLEQQVQQLKSDLVSLKTEFESLNEKFESEKTQWESKLHSLSAQNEKLDEEANHQKERALSMERTNNMQAKLLTKVEVDGQGLRKQYAELQKRERELTDLIKELHGKLELASKFFRQLQSEHPELLEHY